MKRGTSGIDALVAIDKPLGMTSHDVVSRVRRVLGEGRVGHAGTLDPDASGVLVVGIGQGTRLMGYLTAEEKGYSCTISFGTETTTDDAAGEILRTAEVPDELSDPVQAAAFVASLVGTHEQVPPSFSAISVDGVRSYDRARRGESVELEPRRVRIVSARLDGIDIDATGLSWKCSFEVSKGCYIRSIARDMGRTLETAAHVSALRRTSSGSITLDSCVALDDFEREGAAFIARSALDPFSSLGLPVRSLVPGELDDVRCGRRIPLGDAVQVGESELVSLSFDGALAGIWRREGKRLVSCATFPGLVRGPAHE